MSLKLPSRTPSGTGSRISPEPCKGASARPRPWTSWLIHRTAWALSREALRHHADKKTQTSFSAPRQSEGQRHARVRPGGMGVGDYVHRIGLDWTHPRGRGPGDAGKSR